MKKFILISLFLNICLMGAMAQTPKGFVSIEVDADFFNFAGQKVLSLKNSLKADISTLSKGIYQV